MKMYKKLRAMGNIGLKESVIFEKESGLPKRFKVPRVQIPQIKLKGVNNVIRRRTIKSI